jgi:hypothetical protein
MKQILPRIVNALAWWSKELKFAIINSDDLVLLGVVAKSSCVCTFLVLDGASRIMQFCVPAWGL